MSVFIELHFFLTSRFLVFEPSYPTEPPKLQQKQPLTQKKSDINILWRKLFFLNSHAKGKKVEHKNEVIKGPKTSEW